MLSHRPALSVTAVCAERQQWPAPACLWPHGLGQDPVILMAPVLMSPSLSSCHACHAPPRLAHDMVFLARLESLYSPNPSSRLYCRDDVFPTFWHTPCSNIHISLSQLYDKDKLVSRSCVLNIAFLFLKLGSESDFLIKLSILLPQPCRVQDIVCGNGQDWRL